MAGGPAQTAGDVAILAAGRKRPSRAAIPCRHPAPRGPVAWSCRV